MWDPLACRLARENCLALLPLLISSGAMGLWGAGRGPLCGSVWTCSGAGGIFARPDPLRGSRGLLAVLAVLPLVKNLFELSRGDNIAWWIVS